MAKRTCSKPSSSKENQVLPPSKRFNFDMEDDDFEELSKGFVPPNTVADTRKCVRLFQDWAKNRNARFSGDKVSQDILLTDDHQSLSCWLSKFCTEIHKVDGTHYPPRTIQHYLLGIQRYIRACEQGQINLFTDSDFSCLRKLNDALYCKLHSEGIGSSINHTETLTDEDEEKLWQSGVLNPDTPQDLLNCVFFLNGKNFCLRGVAEHRDLKMSKPKRAVVKLTGKYVCSSIYLYRARVQEQGRRPETNQAGKQNCTSVRKHGSEPLPRPFA